MKLKKKLIMDKDEYDDGGGAALSEFYDNKKIRGIRAGEITLWTSSIGSGYSKVAQRRLDEAIPFPDKWEVGQRVVWVRGDKYGYTYPGLNGRVVKLSEMCQTRKAHEYQFFWCRPDKMDHGKFLESTNTIKPIRAKTARESEVTHEKQ